MQGNYENTYWNGKGKYPSTHKALQELVPGSGEVPNAKKNRWLEKFRVACNCYYDLYNNGLCNRAVEFRRIFGFSGQGELTQELIDKTEEGLNDIILSAADEQGVVQ